jgi:hypothetical protein
VFGRWEGPGILPFYCRPEVVGKFAVPVRDLREGSESALFQLFVGLAMYQARRDVLIQRQQRELPGSEARGLVSLATLERRIRGSRCPALVSAVPFDAECSVGKSGGVVDCLARPGARCHVKDATRALNRMGDLGKLPTSAWLHCWRDGRLPELYRAVLAHEPEPLKRADLLVGEFAQVYRVGRKLATLFVSALSVPALACGCTPWFPEVDGNGLVIVDTHVARAVDALQGGGDARSYGDQVDWLRRQAALLDLRWFHPAVPGYSPRLVQQALYSFGSRSNRVARGDGCARGKLECDRCVPSLCPFGAG